MTTENPLGDIMSKDNLDDMMMNAVPIWAMLNMSEEEYIKKFVPEPVKEPITEEPSQPENTSEE